MWIASAVWILAATAEIFLLFTLLWIAAPQGWSGAQTALIVLALCLPTLAGGVLGGRAVDRYGGRPAVLLDVAGRAVLMLGLALAGWNGGLPLGLVLAIGAVAGALSPLSYTGVRWLVPRLVAPADLPRANAAVALGDQLPLLGGAALVGPALATLGPGRCMLVPAVMLGVAAALALRLPSGGGSNAINRDQTEATAMLGERRSAWRSPRVLALTALSSAYYLAYGPFEPVMPAFVREQLNAGEATYSLLWMLFAAGAIATLPIAPRLARRRPGVVNALGAICWGLVMLPVALVGDAWLAAVVFLAGGAVWGPYSTVQTTAIHRWTDPAQHGRVLGTQRALLFAAAPVGAALGAVALDHTSAPVILAISALGCTAAGLLALTLPDLRRAG